MRQRLDHQDYCAPIIHNSRAKRNSLRRYNNVLAINILGVARGGRYNSDTGTVTFPGGSDALEPFTPIAPTPSILPALAQPDLEPPTPLPVEVIEVLDNPKLTRLDTWRDRKRDEDEPSGA